MSGSVMLHLSARHYHTIKCWGGYIRYSVRWMLTQRTVMVRKARDTACKAQKCHTHGLSLSLSLSLSLTHTHTHTNTHTHTPPPCAVWGLCSSLR